MILHITLPWARQNMENSENGSWYNGTSLYTYPSLFLNVSYIFLASPLPAPGALYLNIFMRSIYALPCPVDEVFIIKISCQSLTNLERIINQPSYLLTLFRHRNNMAWYVCKALVQQPTLFVVCHTYDTIADIKTQFCRRSLHKMSWDIDTDKSATY